MYFGVGPFGLGFGYNNPPPPPNLFNQQPPGFVPQPNNPQYRPPNQNQPGFFSGLQNFLNNNFMNPFQPNNRPQQPPQPQPAARPTFTRRSNVPRQQQRGPSVKKEEKPGETSGIFWKLKGNEAYQKGDYTQAIQFYTKAIEINSSETVFFSNRAQCYKKLGRIEDALRDAQEAIELDSNNVRGHLVAGQALAEIGKQEQNIRKVELAVTRFTKALTLSGGKRVELQKEVSRYIYLAKKLLFYLRFALLRNCRIQAVSQYKEYLSKDPSLDEQTKQNKLRQFLQASNQQLMFSIPDYLQCRITLEIMQDPVMTDSGQTYERQALELHIQKNGRTDPFTRQPIKGALYPNVAIRKAVQDFLQRNPWAYEYTEGETYKDIVF